MKRRKFPLLHEEIPGKHLEPIGIQVGDYIVDLNPLDKFIEPIASRRLEKVAIQFLEQLEQRAQEGNGRQGYEKVESELIAPRS